MVRLLENSGLRSSCKNEMAPDPEFSVFVTMAPTPAPELYFNYDMAPVPAPLLLRQWFVNTL